ncbi:uncharacterized protein LOC127789078 isoform X2 [Diospyros lotus]|uniref:uncharacterized protein LOC127789078 isoform X2 n=1 Tax=Diospyros lotus TaxID=55363 RepID=UPI0022521118|nr:uncharacterized protein LOC127789078 isoform X2 [Diospyros lotus]
MTATPCLTLSLRLMLLQPLPPPFTFSSSNLFFFHSPNPSCPFNNFSSFPSSSSSLSSSQRRFVGRRNTSFRSLSPLLSSRRTVRYPSPRCICWLCGCAKNDQNIDSGRNGDNPMLQMFGSDEEVITQIPTQAQSVVKGSGEVLVSEYEPVRDVDYLQELLAIQQQGPRAIGFFGTRNMGFMHQELIEILSYAMVITKNHIYTSGSSGTNAAVIRGALRAEKPELLTVILPQSLSKQPPESQELLAKVIFYVYMRRLFKTMETSSLLARVKNVIEKPHNDHLPLIEASSAGYATWTSFHMFSKSYALLSMTASCSWKHVKKPRILERL